MFKDYEKIINQISIFESEPTLPNNDPTENQNILSGGGGSGGGGSTGGGSDGGGGPT